MSFLSIRKIPLQSPLEVWPLVGDFLLFYSTLDFGWQITWLADDILITNRHALSASGATFVSKNGINSPIFGNSHLENEKFSHHTDV
jgi:hypothetical protein